jgi:recombination protein RecT
MSTEQSTALAPRDRMRDLVTKMQDKIAAVLPKHLTPERMVQIVLVEGNRNPKLRECTPGSLAASVMLASELGLEPSGPLGKFYLIPRKMAVKGPDGRTIPGKFEMQCTPLVGYKGLAELAYRTGELARLNAGVVYTAELASGAFTATLEPPEIRHAFTPHPFNRDDDEIALAYATAETKDGARAQVILTRSQIEDRRARSQASGSGPWVTDYAAQCRKTALRALLTGGLVPLSAEARLARALEAEHEDNIARLMPPEERADVDLSPLIGLVPDPADEDVIDVPTDDPAAVVDETGATVPDPPEPEPPKGNGKAKSGTLPL